MGGKKARDTERLVTTIVGEFYSAVYRIHSLAFLIFWLFYYSFPIAFTLELRSSSASMCFAVFIVFSLGFSLLLSSLLDKFPLLCLTTTFTNWKVS